MTDDPLDGPGGVGFSWFKIEIVTLPVVEGSAVTIVHRQQRAMSVASIVEEAQAQMLKTMAARTWIEKQQSAVALLKRVQRAVSRITNLRKR